MDFQSSQIVLLLRSNAAPALVFVFLLAITWISIDYVRMLRFRRRLPPGPFPLPFVGNYFTMLGNRPWIKWEKLSFHYDNPLLTLWCGSRPIVVCNDAWTISDLFEKRANIYSSRPHMVMMGDMLNTTINNQVCLKYDDQWRLHRKLTAVGSQAVKKYRSFQGDETKILLRDLMNQPEEFVASIERYSCSIVSIVGWGRRIDQINDYVGQQALEFMGGVDLVIPGQFLMEVLPFLAKLPVFINPLPTIIISGANKLHRYFFNLSKEAAEHSSEDKFATSLLKLRDAEVENLTANLIGGRVDTTSSTMISLVLAMCCFPEKQRKAQEELDTVVGQDRMPQWDDELPYVSALVAETLRWRTVTVLGGLPHASIEDDVYRGYLIPKDTWIVGNIWAIHRNPRDYPDPDDFRPERFLNGLERPHPSKKGYSALGWSRRQYSGQSLAEQGLFVTAARLLWAFEVTPGLDSQGRELPLDIFAYTRSENQRPEPFKARFIPRTAGIKKLVETEAYDARKRLRLFDGESKIRM